MHTAATIEGAAAAQKGGIRADALARNEAIAHEV
jgi:hypothetical protein